MCPKLTTGTTRGMRGASRKFLAFEKTAKSALRKAISTSPATSASRPEKIISQSRYSEDTQRRMTNSAIPAGIGTDCFQRTASEYRLPADRSEAPTATSSSRGCWVSNRTNRVPTAPVAPKIPTKCQYRRSQGRWWIQNSRRRKISAINSSLAVAFLKLRDGIFDGYIPHRFFGKVWVLDIKCLASIILIVSRMRNAPSATILVLFIIIAIWRKQVNRDSKSDIE